MCMAYSRQPATSARLRLRELEGVCNAVLKTKFVTALDIWASHSQNTLGRCNFHSPRKMSPLPTLPWLENPRLAMAKQILLFKASKNLN